MSRPLRIALGDLSYLNGASSLNPKAGWDSNLYVPLNIGFLASYAKRRFGRDVDVRLFKDPAAMLQHIRDELLKRGVRVPLVGDFHYIGHKLLAENPACAEALDKYRINPGNVGFKDKKDRQFSDIIEIALRNDKPVRIGVNWGSLDQELLTRLMDENAAALQPKRA